MLISLLVLLVPVLLIVWFFQSAPEPEVDEVDVTPVLQQAEEESPYPVLRPQGLPEGWLPIRVRWAADGERWIDGQPAVGNSWQLGYLSPGDIYVGLQQRDRSAGAFLDQVTRDGKPDGEPVELAGRTWEPWVSEDGRTTSLVWQEGQQVAAVTGDTGVEELSVFAEALTEG